MISVYEASDLEKKRQTWDKICKNGKTRFLISRGLLGGMACTIADTCMEIFIKHSQLYRKPLFLGFATLCWCSICCSIALSAWRRNEKLFENDSQE